MKKRHHLNKSGKDRRLQFGQSMVEYTVVIAFGILTLSTDLVQDEVDLLMAAMHQNYAGYSFALSISDYPDYDSASEYWGELNDKEVNDDMKDVLTDKIKQDSTRNSAKYTTAVEYYQTSSPVDVQPTILSEAGDLKNLSIP